MMIVFWILLVVFVLVCVLLCFFVLIQSDKGGGISGAIGGGLGGAQSLLGTQDTANFLTRATVGLGIAFLVLCVGMSFIMSKQTFRVEKSMLQKRAEKQQSYSPASVLDRGAGLPIKPAAAGKQGAVSPNAGLPIARQQAPAAAPAPQQKQGSASAPAAQSKALPVGAIPIGPGTPAKAGGK